MGGGESYGFMVANLDWLKWEALVDTVGIKIADSKDTFL